MTTNLEQSNLSSMSLDELYELEKIVAHEIERLNAQQMAAKTAINSLN